MRCCGAYSNASRGKRRKAAAPAEPSSLDEPPREPAVLAVDGRREPERIPSARAERPPQRRGPHSTDATPPKTVQPSDAGLTCQRHRR